MKGMILQLIVVASGVSSFVERKIRWYCSVVYVMSNFKNFNHITSKSTGKGQLITVYFPKLVSDTNVCSWNGGDFYKLSVVELDCIVYYSVFGILKGALSPPEAKAFFVYSTQLDFGGFFLPSLSVPLSSLPPPVFGCCVILRIFLY